MTRYTQIKNYGTISLGNSAQRQAEVQSPVLGDLHGLIVSITIASDKGTGGAYGSGVCTYNVINKLTVKDRNGNALYDFSNITYGVHDIELVGNALAKAIKRGLAKALGSTAINTSTGAGVSNTVIPVYVPVNLQPISVSLTIGTLSDIFSTIGTGASCTATIVLGAIFDTPAEGNLPIIKSDAYNITGVSSGINRFETFIPSGVQLLKTLLFSANSESYINELTFRSGATVELENVIPAQLIAIEGVNYPNFTHRSGLLDIPHASFIKTNNTLFSVSYSTGENPRIIHVFKETPLHI